MGRLLNIVLKDSLIISDLPQYFKKQSYTLRLFIQDIKYSRKISRNLEHTLKQFSRQFLYYIALTSTVELGCPYCLWLQENSAPEYGCQIQTINAVKSFDFKHFSTRDKVALQFAKHYGESRRNPSIKEIKKLIDSFGKEKSTDIINFLHMVSIGNLMGNTVDAFESRFKGITVKNGSIFFELFIYLIGGFLIKRLMLRKGLKMENNF
ncbi:MAG: hypothetical protein ACXAC7_17570 [Candidatus Hodarchaeales archaeon]